MTEITVSGRRIRRNTWSEMRQYWEAHDDLRANVDWSSDPDGLDNVCHAGAPAWLNAYYAHGQRNVYSALLSRVPEATRRRALEVGCGAGRWCRLLSEKGYDVTGIDLQSALITRNRQRYPEIAFHCCSLQEYEPESPFDLVSSVTVLQHVPFGEQTDAIASMRSALVKGGHAIALENSHDQASHVFSRSIRDWIDLFGHQGFQVTTVRRYDYNPTLRAIGFARRLGRQALRRSSEPTSLGSDGSGAKEGLDRAKPGRGTSQILARAQQIAVSVDSLIEGPLVKRNARLPTVHAGYLFRAV